MNTSISINSIHRAGSACDSDRHRNVEIFLVEVFVVWTHGYTRCVDRADSACSLVLMSAAHLPNVLLLEK